MKWEFVRLGDYCTKIGSGATPKGGATAYIDSGTSLIRSQNVYNLNFEYDGLVYITDEASKKLDGVTIFKNDILLNITGDSVARSCIVPVDVLPARVNQHVSIIRTKEKYLMPEFLSYYLVSPYMQAYMLNLAVGKGASRNALTKDMIASFPIPLPTLKEQEKIADFLLPYDNLIENNQKQIKLLEEAAQRLYKEWFVDLRFPGYEKVPIVDGVPKGWNKSLLKEISEFKRGKTITKDSVINGSIPVVAGGLEPAYYHNKANTTAPVITVSGSGANAGFTRLYYNDVWASDCSFVDSNNTEYIYFVYCFLKNNKDRIDNLQKGSAQPHVYAKDINALSLNLPNTEILNIFSEIIEPYFALIGKLQKQIRAAEQARDRLLPKLMSGELEV